MTTEVVLSEEPAARPHRRGFPGVAFVKSTSGLQRVTLLVGLALMVVFVIAAVFAPLLAPYGFSQTSDAGQAFARQAAPSAEHWFGTSVRGEDVFSRVIYGARTALMVIASSLLLSLIIGVPLGLASGYIGRWFDRVLVLFMDAMYAFPSLLLAVVISIVVAGGQSSSFGGIASAAIAITAIFVPQYFRVVRNATVAVKTEPYVDAARVTGAGTPRILFRHILANVVQTLPVIITRRAGVTGFDYAKLVAFDVACHDYGHDCDHQYSCQELLGPTCQHIYTFLRETKVLRNGRTDLSRNAFTPKDFI